MLTSIRQSLLLAAAALLIASCGSSNALPGITPSIVISSPTDNSSVSLPANKQVALNFNTNYTLRAPGTCAGTDNCGHVYVLVDNSNCNLASLPYNTLAVSSPTTADMSRCATPTGMHDITVSLRHDDGSQVLNLFSTPITSKVTVTAQ